MRIIIWRYCWFFLFDNYNGVISNSPQYMIRQKGNDVEIELSKSMWKTIGTIERMENIKISSDLEMFTTDHELAMEQTQFEEKVNDDRVNFEFVSSDKPTPWLKSTSDPTSVTVSSTLSTGTVPAVFRSIPTPSALPSILVPTQTVPPTQSTKFVSSTATTIPSELRRNSKHVETIYTRNLPNSSPRTPYNDILKNIQLKLPKRLANESLFIQSHRLSYYTGSTRLKDSTLQTQPSSLISSIMIPSSFSFHRS